MGQSKRRRDNDIKEVLADILAQSNDPEMVQVPIQKKDGWYRGVSYQLKDAVLQEWEKHKGDRQLLLYRIDKYWITQSWQTKQGNLAYRGDLIVEVRPDRKAKELWLNTVSQPHFIDAYRDQIETVNRGKQGCVQFWWLRRYLLCRASLGLQNLPVNHWEYRPIVEVHHPDGTVEESAIDLVDFLEQPKVMTQDPKTVDGAAPWEIEIFNNCIIEKIIKSD